MNQNEINRQCSVILERVRIEILDPVQAIEELKELLERTREWM